MYRLRLIINAAFAAFSFAVSAALPAAAEGPAQKAVVFGFRAYGEAAGLGGEAAGMMRAALRSSGQYDVPDWGAIGRRLEEQAAAQPNGPGRAEAADMGKLLKADLAVTGAISASGGKYSISVRFIDTGTGEVVFGRELQADGKGELPALCGRLVKMLLDPGARDERADVPEGIHRSQVPATRDAAPGPRWTLGLFYPGAGLRYADGGKNAWEVRAQAGPGILAGGARYYRYTRRSGNPRLFGGLEGAYLTFKDDRSKGAGFARGAFAGGELALTQRLSLEMDFGALLISVRDRQYSKSESGVEYVVNTGVYWRFK